ncbi:hypothetical protein bcgnr5406_23530 [Bacillus cereus]
MNYVTFEGISLKNRSGGLLRIYKCLFYNHFSFLFISRVRYFLIHVAIHNEKAVNNLISIHVGKKRTAKIFLPIKNDLVLH